MGSLFYVYFNKFFGNIILLYSYHQYKLQHMWAA